MFGGHNISVDSCLLSEVDDLKTINKGIKYKCDAGRCSMYLDMVNLEAALCSFFLDRYKFKRTDLDKKDFIPFIWEKVRSMAGRCPHNFF